MNLRPSSILRISGIILTVIGCSMIPSVIVSVIYDGSAVYMPFIKTAAAVIIAGLLLLRFFRKSDLTLRPRDGFFIITLCWLLSALLGTIPFMATGSIPEFHNAFFESCSGFSTTGATILDNVESMPRGILFWRSFTHWIGGMGILVFAIAVLPSLGINGQNIAVAEASAPSLDRMKPKVSDTAKLLYIIYAVLTIAETIMLLAGGMGLYDALIATFGSVSTGGFSNYAEGIAHFDSTYIRMTMTLFMFLSAINFNLYYMCLKYGPSALLRDSEFKLFIGVFVFALGAVFTSLSCSGICETKGEALSDSVFQVTSIMTSTGYTTADYTAWPALCQVVLLLLMLAGSCSSSTGGGIKIVRMLVLFKLIRRNIRARIHPNAVQAVTLNGSSLPGETGSAIIYHVFLYISIIFAGAFILSFEDFSLLSCFSSVIACLGNVGPGFDSVGPADTYSSLSALSKYVLSLIMLAGRLELYTLFLILTPRFWNPNR